MQSGENTDWALRTSSAFSIRLSSVRIPIVGCHVVRSAFGGKLGSALFSFSPLDPLDGLLAPLGEVEALRVKLGDTKRPPIAQRRIIGISKQR